MVEEPMHSCILFIFLVEILSLFKHICDSDLCVFLSGQQYSEEFGKINVMRKVPVMKDGSFVLTERYNKDLG